ncbi:hypothetical protein PR048_015981 [Dryococelus australis]|uniref:Uncharacterized protein n=1 Tax=Dryococelus australis TaxID=614101 RepID=A0ABQ9HIT4_9NEOP|nr:hypothetical protein PR048_015981 [Dryococelus australis]
MADYNIDNFTPGQPDAVTILEIEKKKKTFFEELKSVKVESKEIVKHKVTAILHRYFTRGSVSPKGYRYLRNKLKFPLPSITTLRRWSSKIDCRSRSSARCAASYFKKCCKFLREGMINSTNDACFNSVRGKLMGPHKAFQVVMAYGLFSTWRQPVYYDFDAPMTESRLKQKIISLESSGYPRLLYYE